MSLVPTSVVAMASERRGSTANGHRQRHHECRDQQRNALSHLFSPPSMSDLAYSANCRGRRGVGASARWPFFFWTVNFGELHVCKLPRMPRMRTSPIMRSANFAITEISEVQRSSSLGTDREFPSILSSYSVTRLVLHIGSNGSLVGVVC